MGEIILTIDCGTQSLRTLLFDSEGALLDMVKMDYESYFSIQPGWAEKDAEELWQSLITACKKLKSKNRTLFSKIRGVGVTCQRDTMVCLDERGMPLRPAILWLDQRKAKINYRPKGLRKLGYLITGMDEAIAKTQVEGACNWIMQNEPKIWEKTYKFTQLSTFFNFRLTGNFCDSTASQIGHIPFNYRNFRWCKKGELLERLFPVPPEKLVELAPPGEALGSISKEAVKALGIPEGVPVIACGSDKGCETIGMGVINPSTASLSFGTTATVQTTTDKYYEPIRFMPSYSAPIPGHYNPEVEIYRGYWMITWFKEQMAYEEVQEAKKNSVPPEVVLNSLLTQIEPGSMGLILQPFWGPGLKNPAAKGAIIGFGDVHTKAHIYRAVIEGLGYALLDGLQKIEKVTGIKADQAAVSGGAAQSDEICQISADIFNIPMHRGKTFETAGLGAAVVTAAGIGSYPSIEDAIGKMVSYEKTFSPNRDHVDLYKTIFERVYRKMYRSLYPLYKEIREIVGYPEKL